MDGCSFACATVGDRTSRALVWLPGTRGLSNLAQHDLGLHRIQCCVCCTTMSRLGTVGVDALRVALCAVEMTGTAAEQIDDVDAIVDKHCGAWKRRSLCGSGVSPYEAVFGRRHIVAYRRRSGSIVTCRESDWR